MTSTLPRIRRFGPFELDLDAGELRRDGRRIKVQPQPFRLLVLLTNRPGMLITREEIRSELWPEGTFVDFDQSVNFAVRQIRDALGDAADRPLYVETIPRRGYRFIAPVEAGAPAESTPVVVPLQGETTVRLQKALWSNIADLRIAEERRRRVTLGAMVAGVLVLAVLITYVVIAVR